MRCATLCTALVATLLLGMPAAHGARRLRGRSAWEPLQGDAASTYTTTQGQQPSGLYATTGEKAEAAVSTTSKGIRYNGGRTVFSGDVYPGPRASSTTGNAAARSGNTASEANVNLGLQAVAATSLGARAVAGSGVHHTAENGTAVSNNIASFRPATVTNRGSVAFTDVSHNSAAVAGMGNGPVATAWGNEVGAMARAHRSKEPANLSHDRFDLTDHHRRSRSLLRH